MWWRRMNCWAGSEMGPMFKAVETEFPLFGSWSDGWTRSASSQVNSWAWTRPRQPSPWQQQTHPARPSASRSCLSPTSGWFHRARTTSTGELPLLTNTWCPAWCYLDNEGLTVVSPRAVIITVEVFHVFMTGRLVRAFHTNRQLLTVSHQLLEGSTTRIKKGECVHNKSEVHQDSNTLFCCHVRIHINQIKSDLLF